MVVHHDKEHEGQGGRTSGYSLLAGTVYSCRPEEGGHDVRGAVGSLACLTRSTGTAHAQGPLQNGTRDGSCTLCTPLERNT